MTRKRCKKDRLPKRSRGWSKCEKALREKITGSRKDVDDRGNTSSSSSSPSSSSPGLSAQQRRKRLRRERPSDTSYETENESDHLVSRMSQVSFQVSSEICEFIFDSMPWRRRHIADAAIKKRGWPALLSAKLRNRFLLCHRLRLAALARCQRRQGGEPWPNCERVALR